jgi:hypothetical protein
LQAGGPRHRVYQKILSLLARLDQNDLETPSATNLLIGLFALKELTPKLTLAGCSRTQLWAALSRLANTLSTLPPGTAKAH